MMRHVTGTFAALRPARLDRATLREFLDVRSIRSRLVLGFGTLILLFFIAVLYARSSMMEMSAAIEHTLATVQNEAKLSSRLSAAVALQMEAGSHYLEQREPAAALEFATAGWEAHAVQRAMNALPDQRADEVALVAEIDARHSSMENHFARAHRLADLGRQAAAEAEARRARSVIDSLLGDVERLGALKATKVANATDRLAHEASSRSWLLLTTMALAITLGTAVVLWVITSVTRHLRALVVHAQRLSEGDLTARTMTQMPGEFEVLAKALNHTSQSLETIVGVVARTADDVATSAQDLATVSEQISTSAGQMANAMSEVSTGADGQVRHLRRIDDALQTIRGQATGVRDGASEVGDLARHIADAAAAKRAEIERAVMILNDIRSTVLQAAAEVNELNVTAADINRFVGSVSRIAEQTNLLALNAAIEAARAGQAGRGFAVVADEVRKLAEQAEAAANEIVQMTGAVTARVASTSRVMESGASRVQEIERVSRDIDEALSAISSAADRTRQAASAVTSAAESNELVVIEAAMGIAEISKTAEGHAATAQEVSAGTEQQSAACEQMNSASAQLTEGSVLLRQLVRGLRTSTAN